MRKNNVLRWVGIGALTLGFFFNLQYALIDYGMLDGTLGYQLAAQANTGGGTGGGSTDDGGGSTDDGGGSTDGGDPSCKFKKEVTCSQHLYVKSIIGDADVSATIGMRITAELALQLKGKITTESADDFKIDCYANAGKDCCTQSDWERCPTQGCNN